MPSATTRSASISSISTSTSKNSDASIKKFCCNFSACGKSFSRSEHLHRHALNHKDGNNTCLRCSAHFRRRDLLDRHMARHKEKDDEAGGEGLGILATRKRLWRDANGNIVNARRPSYPQEGAKRRQITRADRKSSTRAQHTEDKKIITHRQGTIAASLRTPPIAMSRAGSASSTIVVDTGAQTQVEREREAERKFEEEMQRDSWLDMDTIPSSPLSESSLHSAAHPPSADLGELDALYEDASWPPLPHDGLPSLSSSGDETPSLSSSAESSPYFGGSSWGSISSASSGSSGLDSIHSGSLGEREQPFQTFMGAMAELPYDDIFKPESGMYEWQTWNSEVLMSRCREEKYEPRMAEERKLDWGSTFQGQEGFRRTFGLGTI